MRGLINIFLKAPVRIDIPDAHQRFHVSALRHDKASAKPKKTRNISRNGFEATLAFESAKRTFGKIVAKKYDEY